MSATEPQIALHSMHFGESIHDCFRCNFDGGTKC
jgi:hypothetical protein